MTRSFVFVSCVSLLCLSASSDVRAEPVTITNGFVHIDGPPGGLVATTMLLGTDGFRFESLSAVNGLGMFCCPPGPTPAFNGGFEDAGGTARVMVDGRGVNLPVSDNTAFVHIFTGTVTLPPVTLGHLVLTVPFELDGEVGSGDFDMFPNGLVVSFSGRGTARLDLVNEASLLINWQVVQQDYNFAPTPEPATLTMVGGVLVACAMRARKRRDRRSAIQLSTSTASPF